MVMCKVLKVSLISYYYWFHDPEGKRRREQMEIEEKIKKAYFG